MKTSVAENFYNKGFGWICRRCEIQTSKKPKVVKSRLLVEGEAESKTPTLSSSSLVQWTDFKRNALICPKCKLSENI